MIAAEHLQLISIDSRYAETANKPHAAAFDRRTNRQTDTQPLPRPCSAYYTGRISHGCFFITLVEQLDYKPDNSVTIQCERYLLL